LPAEIAAVIWLNLYGYIAKDVDIVERSLHPDSPIRQQTLDVTKQIFEHNLTYELQSIEAVGVTDTEAQVKIVLITRSAMYSPAFKNNMWSGIQYLYRDEQGRWKIWAGDTIELKYI
jgi:predicted ATPase